MVLRSPVLPALAAIGVIVGMTRVLPPAGIVEEAAFPAIYVNPVDPTCGGQSPCFSAIQPAVDAAEGGTVVTLQAGIYTETVVINRKNEEIDASEADRITIQADPNAAIGSVVLEGPGSDCSAGDAITIRRSRFVTIRGLTIDDAAHRAISLSGGTRRNESIHIERNRIVANRCGSAILVSRGNTTTMVVNNLIYDSAGSGVDLKGSAGMHYLIGNTIHANRKSGVLLSPNVQAYLVNNSITGNATAGGDRGVRRRGDGSDDPALVLLKNNLVCGNVSGELEGSLLDAEDSGNQTPTGSEGAGVVANPACEMTEAVYLDADGIDGLPGSVDDDYRPADGSSLIDGGARPQQVGVLDGFRQLINRDHLGAKRPKDGDGDGSRQYDIGAFERRAPVTTPSPTPAATATPTPTRSAVPTPTPSSGVTPTPVSTTTASPGTPTPASTTPTPTGATPTPSPGAPELTTVESSPRNGETSVAVTRETILTFSRPLAPNADVDSSRLFANLGGQNLGARIYVSRDRTHATLFYDDELPAGALVRVTLVTDGLIDESGQQIDGDGDGQPGGAAQFDFETLSTTPVQGTTVFGRVFASELVPGDSGMSENVPLQGVTITVDGAEDTLRAVTDAGGNFVLNPAPGGKFFVHVDGRTATNGVAAGTYYPFVGKAWESVPGRATNVGDIFLPLVPEGTLQPVSETSDTTITFAPSVLAQFPEFAGARIVVPAGSLFANDGTRGGNVGIAPVPPDRMPGQLPSDLKFPIVLTVQTDGATNFDSPAPVCFPNLPYSESGAILGAGAKSALWSFNHDTGNFEVVGPMTVSTDGRLVCTDPGVGIPAPGWHGSLPGGSASGGGGGCNDSCCGSSGSPTAAVAFDSESTAASSCGPPSCGPDSNQCDTANRLCRNTCVLTALNCVGCIATLCGGGVGCAFCAATCGALLAQQQIVCSEVEEKCSCFGPGASSGAITAETLEEDPFSEIDEFIRTSAPLWQDLRQLTLDVEASNVVTEEQRSKLESILANLDVLSGGDILVKMRHFADTLPLNDSAIVAADFPVNRSLHYRMDLVGPPTTLRGRTSSLGVYQQNLASDLDGVIVSVFDPVSWSYGVVASLEEVRPGATVELPDYHLQPLTGSADDEDGDGLPDVAESTVGTSLLSVDTDEDGINDLAEIVNGTDPLDGLVVETGIIGSADTPGVASDICAQNGLAAVAGRETGVSVFNVFNGMNPRLVVQIDTPGDARAVACSSDTIAVADGDGGIAIVDISDPPAARIAHQVGSSDVGARVRAVAISGGVTYSGSEGGRLAAVELATGLLLQKMDLGSSIHDVGVAGGILFAIVGNELRAFDAGAENLLGQLGSVSIDGRSPESLTGRKRLFVGGGRAYVTAFPGYETFDVTNPSAMQRLGSVIDSGPNSFKQIVTNGSDLGVAAVGVNPRDDGTHNVYLYDVSDPTKTNPSTTFLTEFETPGLARAVALFNGLAYVADGDRGLQVVNPLAFDIGEIPPTVSIVTTPAGPNLEEGSSLLIEVQAADDVQVRNVELLVDGAVVETDGNFPYEFSLTVPTLAQQPMLTVEVRAFDTGANVGSSGEMVFNITPDATPPRILRSSPGEGGIGFDLQAITLVASEALSGAALATGGFTLTNLGFDGEVGGGDDQVIPVSSIALSDNVRVNVLLSGMLAPGQYQLEVAPDVIVDLTGNSMATAFTVLFSSLEEPGPNEFIWVGTDPTGDWNNGSNWSGGVVPGAGSSVFIDNPLVDLTIRHTSGSNTIKDLTTAESLDLRGGALTVTGAATINGTFSSCCGAVLAANGAAARFNANGPTFIEGLNMYARGGGQIDLSRATSFSRGSAGDVTWMAETNGAIGLSGLTSIAWDAATLRLTAQSGGRIDLSGLPTFEVSSRVEVTSSGASSRVDLSRARAIGSTNNAFVLTYSGGAVSLDSIQRFEGVSTTLGQTGLLPTQQIQTINRSGITVQGASVLPFTALRSLTRSSIAVSSGAAGISTPSLVDVNGTSFTARGGARITLPPAITSYARGSAGDVTWLAETGGVLDFSSLSTIIWDAATMRVTAQSGGQIDLSGLPGFDVSSRVEVTSSGGVSRIDLSSASAIGSTNNAFVLAYSGGAISLDSIQSFEGVSTTLGQVGLLPTQQIQTINRSGITVQGVSVLPFTALQSLTRSSIAVSGAAAGIGIPNLLDVDGSSFTARGGATIAFPPTITSYARGSAGDVTWLAETSGVLDFSSLSTIAWDAATLRVTSQSGGRIDLRNLPAFEVSSRVEVTSSGAGSRVDLSSAVAIGSNNNAFVLAFSDGAIALDAVQSLEGVSTTLGETGLLPTHQIQTINRSGLTVQGGAVLPFTALQSLTRTSVAVSGAAAGIGIPNLLDITGSSFTAREAGVITLPAGVTSYARGASGDVVWTAETDGELRFSSLTSIAWDAATMTIRARSGGLVDLRNVVGLGSGGTIPVSADGAGSEVNLSTLAQTQGNVTFSATNGGVVVRP